jgi:hypothetical protein
MDPCIEFTSDVVTIWVFAFEHFDKIVANWNVNLLCAGMEYQRWPGWLCGVVSAGRINLKRLTSHPSGEFSGTLCL